MSLIDKIKYAGIVGCGGAGFPTHLKLHGNFEYVIANGAECEPLLFTDRYLMKEKAKELVLALEEVGRYTNAKHCVIALKKEYTEEIKAIEKVVEETASMVLLHKMNSYYPSGDEQIIVEEVTGRIVPPAGIPKDVGAVVSNVATLVSIYDALQGIPFTHKYLTVTGAVKRPLVLKVPVGTSIMECIQVAGGTENKIFSVIIGGPMMGKVYNENEAKDLFVTKTTSGIIVLDNEHSLVQRYNMPLEIILKRAKVSCIQCSFCTELCPRYLLGHPIEPHKIMRQFALGFDMEKMKDDVNILQALLCSECGVCELIACPMGLQPRKVNQFIKKELRKYKRIYTRENKVFSLRQMKEFRSIPTIRIAARAGVMEYYKNKITEFLEYEPNCINVPLLQHIGAPSIPIVNKGDVVDCKMMIAIPPDGAMGANIFSGIKGIVTSCSETIISVKG